MNLLKSWMNAINEIEEYKFGDTNDMRYDGWRKQNDFRKTLLKVMVGFGVFLVVLSILFPSAVQYG